MDNPKALDAHGFWRFHLDTKLHLMLRDLRRALSEAISESSDVSRTLRRIREEGYSLYLLVDCKRESLDDEGVPVAPSRRMARSQPDPVFQIDGRDLAFLKSIGIDPTRKMRKRRRTTAEEREERDEPAFPSR